MRVSLIAGVLCLTGCESQSIVDWHITFADPEVAALTVRVELFTIEDGCDGPTATLVFDATPSDLDGTPVMLPKGLHGFRARALDIGCTVIADACVERTLPATKTLELVLRAAPVHAACPACVEGACEPDDTGDICALGETCPHFKAEDVGIAAWGRPHIAVDPSGNVHAVVGSQYAYRDAATGEWTPDEEPIPGGAPWDLVLVDASHPAVISTVGESVDILVREPDGDWSTTNVVGDAEMLVRAALSIDAEGLFAGAFVSGSDPAGALSAFRIDGDGNVEVMPIDGTSDVTDFAFTLDEAGRIVIFALRSSASPVLLEERKTQWIEDPLPGAPDATFFSPSVAVSAATPTVMVTRIQNNMGTQALLYIRNGDGWQERLTAAQNLTDRDARTWLGVDSTGSLNAAMRIVGSLTLIAEPESEASTKHWVDEASVHFAYDLTADGRSHFLTMRDLGPLTYRYR